MNTLNQRVRPKHARRRLAAVVLAASVGALAGCDGLLDVDLPASLTDEALEDPQGASTQINSIITHFENAYNLYTWEAFGREAGGEGLLCSGGASLCDSFLYSQDFTQFLTLQKSRNFAYDLHEKLGDWTAQQVPDKAKFLAISSIYAGAALNLMGSALCEATIGGGDLMTPDQVLAEADTWLTQALSEIGSAGGDFALPYDIASSARAMAYGLRAQVKWMRGDLAGAAADAAQVPEDFEAYVTREATPDRRNMPYFAGTLSRYVEIHDPVDWWDGPPNPVTGQPWPEVIPFTGWTNLGVLPDGRAVHENGVPVRTEAGAINDRGVVPGAVRDLRVKHHLDDVQARGPGANVHDRYESEASSIPFVTWAEMALIRAEAAGGAEAVNLVNQLRDKAGLPRVTYVDPANAQQVENMIFEERRRELFLEGRFVFTKIKNPDVMWFPRAVGNSRVAGHQLEGGVRWIMPDNEYRLNDNLNFDTDRGTGCSPNEAPVII